MGKNPVDPYLTSFVYFSSQLPLGNKEQEYLQQAAAVAGYPVVYKGTYTTLPVISKPPIEAR